MGKVIVTVQMSADASIGPDLGWFDGRAVESEAAGEDELRLADAMLLGRPTYEGLHSVWAKATGPFADRVNAMPKYVASRSPLGALEWNATPLDGDLATAVLRLKEEHEGNLVSYGCGEFAYALVELGLADEVRYWVHPVVWSEPRRPFHGLGHVRLRHRDTTVFRNGVVRNTYEPLGAERVPPAA